MRSYPHILIFIVKTEELAVDGGIMLGVDQSKTIPNPEDIEVISGQLLTPHPVMIRLVYNPPNSEGIYQHKLISFLRHVIQSNNEVIILGNFNVPDID